MSNTAQLTTLDEIKTVYSAAVSATSAFTASKWGNVKAIAVALPSAKSFAVFAKYLKNEQPRKIVAYVKLEWAYRVGYDADPYSMTGTILAPSDRTAVEVKIIPVLANPDGSPDWEWFARPEGAFAKLGKKLALFA